MSKSWTIYASHTKKLEDKFLPLMEKLIEDAEYKVIADLKKGGIDYARNELSVAVINEKTLNLVHHIHREAGLMGARLQYSLLPKISQLRRPRKALIKANGRMGKDEEWIRTIQDYLQQHGLELAVKMDNFLRRHMVKILQRGVEEGWSVERMVKEMEGLLMKKSVARVRVRTEVNRGANVGHDVAAKSMPYETNKKWSAARDHRTRHSHNLVNNQMVDENEFFTVPMYSGDKRIGKEQMLYPGDPEASAGNVCNCRCRVLYVPKTDANGNIIMRNPNQAPVIPMRQAPSQEIGGIAAVLKSRVHIGVDK